MRSIKKRTEPASWRKHRTTGGSYEDYKETDDARSALLSEQGHLCCFCMRRITVRAMKIAHWVPQSADNKQTMDWDNVMGACPGGDGERGAIKHCDTHQGSTPLTVNPVNETQQCERFIRYLANGEVYSDNAEIDKDLKQTLNLNTEVHVPKRKELIDVLRSHLEKRLGKDGAWSSDELKREIDRWNRRDKKNMLKEYCQVAIYYLEKWHRKAGKVSS